MIAQLGQLLGSVPEVLMQGFAWVFSLWMGWAIWTVLMCAPIYLLALGVSLFGIKSKFMSKIVTTTVKINALAASAPVSLPILALYHGTRLLFSVNSGNQRQGNRNQRRGRQPQQRYSLVNIDLRRRRR